MKGLILNEPMARAWLEGRKTITRRLSGLKEINKDPDRYEFVGMVSGPGTSHAAFRDKNTGDQVLVRVPYRPDETVYIKETWGVTEWYENDIHKEEVVYKSTEPTAVTRWKSPRFMPEWASRSYALIVSVRPERIRNIDNPHDEVSKEGWPFPGIDTGMPYKDFSILWESLHPGSWERNDWVWRYELEKQQRGGRFGVSYKSGKQEQSNPAPPRSLKRLSCSKRCRSVCRTSIAGRSHGHDSPL